MKTWNTYVILLGIAITSISCDKVEDCCVTAGELQSVENVFSDPRVGATSYYVAFESEVAYTDGRWFITKEMYLPDTLEIKVIALNNGIYTLSEQYTSGSQSVDQPPFPGMTDSVRYFDMIPTAKGWRFLPHDDTDQIESILLGYGGKYELPTDSGSVSLFAESVSITTQGRRFENLSLSYDYAPMAYDGSGRHWYYTRQLGILRFGYIGAMIPKGSGWDLISQSEDAPVR